MHMMTDRWGMLPYSEALQGAANFQPAYDYWDETKDYWQIVRNKWTEKLTNKNILISAHGNSIRALCKYLFKLDKLMVNT